MSLLRKDLNDLVGAGKAMGLRLRRDQASAGFRQTD